MSDEGRHHWISDRELLERVYNRQENTMADLSNLKTAVSDLTQSVDKVAQAVADGDNQSDVDSITATITDAVSTLNGLVPDPTPEPDPTPAP